MDTSVIRYFERGDRRRKIAAMDVLSAPATLEVLQLEIEVRKYAGASAAELKRLKEL
jgi:hypothetical protein